VQQGHDDVAAAEDEGPAAVEHVEERQALTGTDRAEEREGDDQDEEG